MVSNPVTHNPSAAESSRQPGHATPLVTTPRSHTDEILPVNLSHHRPATQESLRKEPSQVSKDLSEGNWRKFKICWFCKTAATATSLSHVLFLSLEDFKGVMLSLLGCECEKSLPLLWLGYNLGPVTCGSCLDQRHSSIAAPGLSITWPSRSLLLAWLSKLPFIRSPSLCSTQWLPVAFPRPSSRFAKWSYSPLLRQEL